MKLRHFQKWGEMKLRQSPNSRGVSAYYKAILVQDGVFFEN